MATQQQQPNTSLVTRNVPKVTGGVSQKSAVTRDPSQCTELVNVFPDPTFGMSRRPSSVFNTTVADFTGEHYLYTFSFSETEKYALFVKDGALTVVDLINKQEMTVNVETGAEDYLASSDPSKDFHAMTIGNETLVLNRAITVAQDNSTTSNTDTPVALVWVRLGDFGTTYTINVDGTDYSYTTNNLYRPGIDTAQIAFTLKFLLPCGNSLTRINLFGTWADSDHFTLTETISGKSAVIDIPYTGFQDPPGVRSLNGIMLNTIGAYFYASPPASGNLDDLYAVIPGIAVFFAGNDIWIATPEGGSDNINFTATSNTSATGGVSITNSGVRPNTYSASLLGASLYFQKVDSTDFAMGSVDGLGDQALESYKGDTQKFSDLPVAAPNTFKLHITGELSTEVDDFYVVYDTSNAPTAAGVWRESLKGGELTSLDATTMPYLLTPDGMGGWDFAKAEWNPRAVGDLITNPMPSIVGKTIDDMFFFKNRLGFCAGESRVMSQSGQYFNLFRKSVSQLLDEERIDVASNSAGINHIHHATFQGGELILWGDKGQIAVTGTPLLTPKTIAEEPVGAFKSSPDVKPVQSGRVAYFLTERNGTTQVSEYFNAQYSATVKKDALDLTDEIPTYINEAPSKLEASPANDLIFVGKQTETIT